MIQTHKKKSSFFILIFFIFTLFSQSITPVFADLVAVGNTQTFLVSAYYSPLPNQQSYVWGSYEADKRVNGEGVRGADFTKVYAGMLAAPSSYPFGTKIYIPGFGTGTVHDRGGKINESGNGDRIDVWMGWGDDGRKRALQWGMKTVTGTIKPWDTQDNVQINFLPASHQKNYGTNNIQTENNQKEILSLGNKGQSVTNLQNFLHKRGYLTVEPTGYFGNKTTQAVILFQLDYNIIANKDEFGSGVFGPKTRAQAEKIWNDPVITKNKEIDEVNIQTNIIEKNPEIVISQENQKPEKISEPYNPDYAIIKPNLQLGDNNQAVKRLQLVLQGMGYFSGNANGIYEKSTSDAVFKYQKEKKIISLETQTGAGRFGPQTYSSLVNELLKKRKHIQSPISSNTDFITTQQLAMRRQKINLALYNVRYGEKNNEVIALQNELIARGFLTEGLNTGYFGNQTQSALQAYKKFVS